MKYNMPEDIRDWVKKPGNHYDVTPDGEYVLYSGNFSGDGIPPELQKLLSDIYRSYKAIPVKFV